MWEQWGGRNFGHPIDLAHRLYNCSRDVVLVDWSPRQFSGDNQIAYAKRMFRELFFFVIFLVLLCYGSLYVSCIA